MFKFKVNKSLQLNGDGVKQQEDYFNFTKVSSFGFPHKPSTLAWDPHLSLIAIGTHTGNIRVYGAPGVCFSAQHKEQLDILDLVFIPKKGSIITLCSDNSLHLWQISTKEGKSELVEVKSYTLSGLIKKIYVIYLKSSADILYVGTMCGNIYTMNIHTFEMAESVIYQDVILQSLPDDVRINPGPVKVICEQPGNSNCLLIGYQKGLVVLWDNSALVIVSFFVGSQNLESISWHRKGDRFMSCHCDGSYIIWSTEDPSKPAEVPMTPYGPFACKAINKIIWKCVKGGDDFIIFNGGMPRAVHGEKSTLSIMFGDKHQVLDLSSKVVDFFTISDSTEDSDFDNPHSLIILLEEELLAIDLESDDWLLYKLPYLDIPHSSPVTCMQFCPVLSKEVSKLLVEMCENSGKEIFTESEWPIKGGKCLQDQTFFKSLLVTGHDNGSVKLWSVSSASMQLLYCFHTSHTFLTYEKYDESEELEDWPPFRKVGSFDPLCDDARLAIKKIVFNDLAKTLIVGGAAGQLLVFSLTETEVEKDIKPTIVHLVGDYNATMVSGHASLMVKPGLKLYPKGFHLQALIQVNPPGAITSLAFHSEWNILAAGTSHGFLLFDITQKKCIMSKCTLGFGDSAVAAVNPEDDPLARSSTLKRSLRESFRKLRKGKSFKQGRDRAGSLSSEMMKDMCQGNVSKRESFVSTPDPSMASSPSPELRSFASESESRHGESVLTSTVRCVHLVQSFILNNVITTPTFWAGTSNGMVYIYTVTIPTSDSRNTETVTCQLGKAIQLKHRAPVISIQIVDHSGYALPDPIEVQQERVKAADLSRSHRVVICTEEQIKVFSLPGMKSICKYKLTAVEHCHANQVALVTFPSKSDLKNTEKCAVCFTNTSEIILYSIPDLRKRISFQYSTIDNGMALSEFIMSRDGCFIFMTSPCEFEMCSLSSIFFAQPSCSMEIPDEPNLESSFKNIMLEVDNVILDSRNGRNDVESDNEMAEANSNHTPAVETQSNDPEAEGNHITPRQFKRAPLARIDELNVSDEHSSSLSATASTLSNKKCSN